MRVEKQLMKMLAEAGDLVNTINGGMSLAHIHNYQLQDHYLVTVKVPGVDKTSLKVELHEGSLYVYQRMHLDDGIDIPYRVASIKVNANVDVRAIHANYQGRNLNIVLPIDETIGSGEIEGD